jgi:hypothetical protein
MNEKEKGREEECILEAQQNAKSLQVRIGGGKRENVKQYAFNMVCGPATSQKQFFDHCGIRGLLDR